MKKNQLKFKISQAPSMGSSLSVNIQLRKWYLYWLYLKESTRLFSIFGRIKE